MKLVLAEKPSAAQNLAAVLGADKRNEGYLEGNGYLVSWCIGHLVELMQPEGYDEKYRRWRYADLPIFPQEWKYQVSSGTKKQFAILKKLMERKDVDSLICATDAGREGELIFRLVYQLCGCQKSVERLWVSSMEDSAIREAFANLKPSSGYDNLYQAAICRERADWLVGMNATRLFSCLYGQTLNVGRVMTPTLAMVVMREAAINKFRPETFYTVQLNLDGFIVVSERIKDREEADAIARRCTGSAAKVVKLEHHEKTEKPPALYDLTSLQRDANRMLGYTAQQTLDYAQSLYENKLITYPRTDSRYLTGDMADKLPEFVKIASQTFPAKGTENIPVSVRQVIHDKKVTDHHAILPTRELQKCDLQGLPKGERAVLQLITNRLICAVGEPYRCTETKAQLEVNGVLFTASGKTVLQDGWKRYTAQDEQKEKSLPDLADSAKLLIHAAIVKQGQTTPEKHFTEDTLLQAMESAAKEDIPKDAERKGLGTPATRAGIIEKLVRIGFLERKGNGQIRYLIPTHKGTALVTVMPEQIQSPSMTAQWEEKLLRIERGEYESEQFMQEIKAEIAHLVQTYEVAKDAELIMRQGKTVGVCPICGAAVEERSKGYFCSADGCTFALWKNNRFFAHIGQTLTSQVMSALLKDGRVRLHGCKSVRTGRIFDTTLKMQVQPDGKINFRMAFEKQEMQLLNKKGGCI